MNKHAQNVCKLLKSSRFFAMETSSCPAVISIYSMTKNTCQILDLIWPPLTVQWSITNGYSDFDTSFVFGMSIMLTRPCNEDPLTPHFYLVKLGFTRVYFFFLVLL